MLGGLTTGDSMSLVLIRADSEQEASALLMNDPAVSGGLLTGEVKGWRVYQSSMRHVGTSPQDERKAEPYRLERLDPAAPISLKENP